MNRRWGGGGEMSMQGKVLCYNCRYHHNEFMQTQRKMSIIVGYLLQTLSRAIIHVDSGVEMNVKRMFHFDK